MYVFRLRFQSLFFWMLLSKLFYRLCPAGVSQRSFNPYFSGCFSLSGKIIEKTSDEDVMFQSLFFWMLLSKQEGIFYRIFTEIRFQSLFFWMLLSK